MENDTATLRLLHLADSALPIGSAAHSFGLESLVADGNVDVDNLSHFLADYLCESGTLEAWHLRAATRMAEMFDAEAWVYLNDTLSAMKPARESRVASATLGRRFLQLASAVSECPILEQAIRGSRLAHSDIHHCTAFGLTAGLLGLAEQTVVLAYLQQTVYNLVSAAQRMLPLGQQGATRILWDLQHSIVAAARMSESEDVSSFTPAIETASMRHVSLETRLFIS